METVALCDEALKPRLLCAARLHTPTRLVDIVVQRQFSSSKDVLKAVVERNFIMPMRLSGAESGVDRQRCATSSAGKADSSLAMCASFGFWALEKLSARSSRTIDYSIHIDSLSYWSGGR